MRHISESKRIIAMGCVLLALAACSVVDRRDPTNSATSDSVAVLPFDSDSSELAGVAAAVYEEVLDQLSVDPDLYIAGREEMRPYLNMNLDPDEIAARLGVGHVVRGSVNLDTKSLGSEIVGTEPRGRLRWGVSYLYSHTGEPNVSVQGVAFIGELSVSEVVSCQSLIASGMVGTVRELILGEHATRSDEPREFVHFPESCGS